MDISFSTPLKGVCKFVERTRNPDTVVLRCGEDKRRGDEMNGGGSFCLMLLTNDHGPQAPRDLIR
jgi:hypothetical protein